MFNTPEYNYTYVSSGSTSQIFSGKGVLFGLSVNSTFASSVVLYDGIASTTQPIVSLKASVAEQTFIYNCSISSGLYITYGAGNYTVLWAKS